MDPQTLGNLAGATMVSTYGAFRLIKMFVSKKKETTPKDPKCPDAGCKGQVSQNKDDIDEIKDDFKDFKADIYPTITQTGKDVEYIRGWIERGKADE